MKRGSSDENLTLMPPSTPLAAALAAAPVRRWRDRSRRGAGRRRADRDARSEWRGESGSPPPPRAPRPAEWGLGPTPPPAPPGAPTGRGRPRLGLQPLGEGLVAGAGHVQRAGADEDDRRLRIAKSNLRPAKRLRQSMAGAVGAAVGFGDRAAVQPLERVGAE